MQKYYPALKPMQPEFILLAPSVYYRHHTEIIFALFHSRCGLLDHFDVACSMLSICATTQCCATGETHKQGHKLSKCCITFHNAPVTSKSSSLYERSPPLCTEKTFLQCHLIYQHTTDELCQSVSTGRQKTTHIEITHIT